MFQIEPIYIIFALLMLVLSILKKNKVTAVLSVACFFFLFSFSKNGSDYNNYKLLYEYIASGKSITEVHGEIGYNLIVKLATTLNMPYHIFRIVLLCTSSTVLFVYVYKFSPNFNFSFFVLFCMFIIYTISAYRQFIVMCLSFPVIYSYIRSNKKIKYLLFSLLLTLFHKSAIIIFILLSFDYFLIIFRKEDIFRSSLFKNIFMFVIIAMAIRIFWCFAYKVEFLNNIFYESTLTFASAGLLSRMSMLLAILVIYNKSNKDKTLDVILLLYTLGMLMYIAVPYEYEMGRLMNNVKILEIILIPLVYRNYVITPAKISLYHIKCVQQKPFFKICFIGFIVIICLVILINQLMFQDGYYPFDNPFINFGGVL